MSAPSIWIDGERQQALPLPDRGLDYGDGLFETLLCVAGRIPFLALHLERLARGLDVLGFPNVVSQCQEYLDRALVEIDDTPHALRLTVTRGAGARGYTPPGDVRPCIVITSNPLLHDPYQGQPPASLGVARIRYSKQPVLAGIKHLNRLDQVLAARERQQHGWDEAIMLDDEGLPVSVVSGNLFIAIGGSVLTPPLQHCGIAGTRRALALRWGAGELDFEVRVERFSLADLEAADEVFFCNSLQGYRAVSRLAERSWSNQTACNALQQHYVEALRCADS